MELKLSSIGRRYGAIKSSPDHRDFGMARLAAPAVLPTKVDLSSSAGPIRDQGALGSCTAFASTAMLEFLYRQYKGEKLVFSPLFQYYNERITDGDFPQDAGSTGRTAVKCINQFGVCLESEEPYDQDSAAQVPTADQIKDALAYKAGAYHAITNVQDMKGAIASGFGFIVGFTVYDSFEADSTASSGLMPMPNFNTESVLGGHEVFFLGYDDSVQCPGASKGAFKVQNSWGTGWGQKGFFWFPYDAAANGSILMDAYVQHFGKPW